MIMSRPWKRKSTNFFKKRVNIGFFKVLFPVQVTHDGHSTVLCVFQFYSNCSSFGGKSFQLLSALGRSFGEGTALVAVMLQREAVPTDDLPTIIVEVAERFVVFWTEYWDSSQVGIGLQLRNWYDTVVAAQFEAGVKLCCYVTHVLLALQTAWGGRMSLFPTSITLNRGGVWLFMWVGEQHVEKGKVFGQSTDSRADGDIFPILRTSNGSILQELLQAVGAVCVTAITK